MWLFQGSDEEVFNKRRIKRGKRRGKRQIDTKEGGKGRSEQKMHCIARALK